MSAYTARAQRHQVARAYRRCCDGLEELGLKPSATLEKVYQTTSQEPPLGLRTRQSASSRRTTSPRSSAVLSAEKPSRPRSASLVRSWRLVTVSGAGGRARPAWPWKWPQAWPRNTPRAPSSSTWHRCQNRARCRRPASATGVLQQPGQPLLRSSPGPSADRTSSSSWATASTL